MDHQTTLNGPARANSSAHALVKNVASIAHDLLTIVELQVALLARDLRILGQGFARGLVAWMVAAALLAAALPTALIGMGLWLADVAHLSAAAGLLWVASGAGVLVAGLIALGWWIIKLRMAGLNRSQKEFHENIAAMKRVLSSYADRGSRD